MLSTPLASQTIKGLLSVHLAASSLGQTIEVVNRGKGCHLMSVLITISHPLSRLASSIVLAQVLTGYRKGRDIPNHILSFWSEFWVLPILSLIPQI